MSLINSTAQLVHTIVNSTELSTNSVDLILVIQEFNQIIKGQLVGWLELLKVRVTLS